MSKHVGTDWEALRIKFINGSMTYKELAETYDLKPATVKKQGERGNWMDERRRLSRDVVNTAQATLLQTRIEELQTLNEADLTIAKNMRVLINRRLASDDKTPLSARDIRSLASAAAEAQRISRLALGVNTESLEVAGQGGGPIKQEHVLTDAQRAAADEILDYFVNGSKA